MVRRAPTPERRQRDAERTKQLILDAGVKEFAAKGYAGARVSEIAGAGRFGHERIIAIRLSR